MRIDVGIVRHLADGGMATQVWHVDESRAAQIAGLLGEPHAQQLATRELAEQVDAVGDLIPTVYR